MFVVDITAADAVGGRDLYGVKTTYLIQPVKRNAKRSPGDFMLQ